MLRDGRQPESRHEREMDRLLERRPSTTLAGAMFSGLQFSVKA